MQNLLSQLNNSDNSNETRAPHIPFVQRIATLPPRLRGLFVIALFLFIGTSFVLLARLNDGYLVEIPRHGGELREGIIGRPRFINPVIARSDADRDMAELIYSGLLRATPDGSLVPDLAESYAVSEDGLTYQFKLRDGLVWHDGEPITADDIAFTIEKVRDPGLAIKSPRRASWDGVTIEIVNATNITFKLKQPYAPFLENATMGIIPKHIWQNVPNEEFDVTYHNIEPIGSGPYHMGSIVQDKDKGLPEYYDLVAFKRYARGEPYITNLRILFFGNNKELTKAYTDHAIDQMHTVEPALAREIETSGGYISEAPLPRIFAAYFNQNQQPIFVDKAVRKALALSVDKDRIVHDVLFGYGRVIDGPLPFVGTPTVATTSSPDRVALARATLESAGWTQNAAGIYEKVDKKKKTAALLEFSIAIPDVPELKSAAEHLKTDWEAIGAHVTLRVFEPSTFTTEILAPRKYDVLFFGQITGRTPDPYAYWHSSQRNAPGLNVALYANKKVDKILEDARKERDELERSLLLESFVTELQNDIPAVFIYSPDFLYATGTTVKGMHMGLITTESERFLDVTNWYIDSERVWKWFAKRAERN